MHQVNYEQQQYPQQSIVEPLHSQSGGFPNATVSLTSQSSSSFSPSSRRNHHSAHPRRHNSIRFTAKYLSIMLISLLLTSLPHPSQAKYRLVPKRKRNNTKRQASNRSNNNKNNNSKPQIILKPKKKKEESPINLQLQATVSTNQHGQKVLLLSPESTEAVESAMQSTNDEVMERSKMEARQQPKQQMAIAEEDVVAAKATSSSSTTKQGSNNDVVELFYHPEELKTAPGEPPLPKKVYDADGNEVDMAGKEALLVKPHPSNPEPKEDDKVRTTSVLPGTLHIQLNSNSQFI